MIDEQTILAAERLRDDLADLRSRLRKQHKKTSQQVRSDALRKEAAALAEKWLVEIAPNREVAAAIGTPLADMNVQFQRLLTFSEHATTRLRYEAALRSILDDYTGRIIVPLKQARGQTIAAPPAVARAEIQSAFVGMSFAPEDAVVNDFVVAILEALGIKVVTGEKPRANTISEKVKGLIEAQSIFVGIFTRRDKIAKKKEWTTSAWVIDEKAYAVGRKPLILIKENGVSSIGGIQGDYEYLGFAREALGDLAVKLIQLFEISNDGLKE